jgi:hypothetical protein
MTEFASRMMAPEDTARVDAYGPIKDIPDQMWGGFMEKLQGDGAPNPQEIAEAVLKLIETPAGERPLRVVVDPLMGGEGANSLNHATGQIQAQILEGFGMKDLLSVKKS